VGITFAFAMNLIFVMRPKKRLKKKIFAGFAINLMVTLNNQVSKYIKGKKTPERVFQSFTYTKRKQKLPQKREFSKIQHISTGLTNTAL